MAKKITGYIKLQLPAGKATPAPPVGPALGAYGPDYSWSALPDAAKWLSSILMLMGRLELFTIILIFTPAFWKKN